MRTTGLRLQSDASLDAIDRVILNQLQAEGRLSNQELAARVHLSPSACLRRVKALEEAGVIADANDYLVRFAYRDAEDLERFHAELLPRLPGVVRSNSMLVLRTVKKTTALAL